MAGKYPTSPLAPTSFPALPVIDGVRFATVEAGVRYKGRKDVMLASLAPGSTMAGVFTRSATRSAPVLDCQEKIGLDSTGGAAIVVNSGNANAFTGKNGIEATRAVTTAAAAALGIEESRVFSSSTGVIGEPLPHDRVTAKLDDLVASLDAGKIEEAAHAIMTTDTFPKGATTQVDLPGGTVKIAGIAKGSGMIAPDMATMLVYIFTDARIERSVLQDMLSALTDITFNCITVDSDTSTSDTLLMGATGASGVEVTADSTTFLDALRGVMMDLAHQVVKDGEGATKFVEIHVSGAASDTDAKTHAMAIANSPLIKTAIAGEDPNWGRVVMAIGKSGALADRDLLTIRFDDVLVAENGWVSPTYKEEQGAAVMKQQEIKISVDLGLGGGSSTVWTCDLTHGYISINADYRS
ncbi:bifunctional glutamate N-acetyltransferase/amino-acid acetyltransferase ArgJ [Pseudooceanicola sediminis]|uniref:Arginine biosynthesis bifunctional protein ArgJ n=1 Tax=Pseudooceanicola sediminis TaxID=2211117 RepID=A0A399J768_9RHOB|nr:bifunctional glutamate N-acetyltransferase/amino-acid acetyltransferase ArgJ [Pseudooceanicola sediminis]KAA2315407.1 bifunctional glutamate N-acetyltransferase/amino-acid acetyltransferase ArgJ [Puniceibacterium sp. HSS470]RII40387.1 bifunctional glutamate N-acetyltransferase/amino-acid acetyltransferase ArgJ [Pseudooceanicola sediminis]|tara:strand:- start:83300 stop:84529 length:1230 start_codon:yes stop_codon:yes gene_type:complete